MTTIANLELLKEAFIWEQNRMQAWITELQNQPVQQNAMTRRLNDAWIAYFQGLNRTDQDEIIGTCTQAITPGGDINEEQAGNMIITDISNDIEYKDVRADIIKLLRAL